MAVLGGTWKRFLDLLPKEPRQAGTVIASLGPGRYRVSLIGGGVVEVRSGTGYSNGTRVFVKGGVIESSAPTLTQSVIEI
jgi:hypothetical protein